MSVTSTTRALSPVEQTHERLVKADASAWHAYAEACWMRSSPARRRELFEAALMTLGALADFEAGEPWR